MFKNILWDFIGKFSVQIVALVISIILTRLLSPSEFGVMGMAMVVILFAHIFLDLGFNKAIIQYQEMTDVQYSTIFYLNAGVAAALTAVCFLIATPLAAFYSQPLIMPVFRVLAISFLINGCNLVPSALLYKRLQLKLNSILTLSSSIVSGVIGVLMAYNGYGVWSLVTQSLLNSFLLLVLNFIYSRWCPILRFDLFSIRPLWAYGSKMFASGVLDDLYTRLDIFIIGKLFSTSVLGFYSRAQSLDSFIRQISVNSIMGALFPYIAKHQDDRYFLTDLYKKYLHVITFVSVALSGTLFLVARNLFLLLFTAKWLFSADLFRLMSIIGFIWPVSSIMCNIIAGVGNSSGFLRLEIIKKTLFFPVYLFGFLFGLNGFLYFFIAGNFLALFVNAAFVSKEIYITIISQFKIMLSYFSIGMLSVMISFFLNNYLNCRNNLISIIVLTLLFQISYLLVCFLLKLDAFFSMRDILKRANQYLNDKRNKDLFTTI